jgi:hypothetical protein
MAKLERLHHPMTVNLDEEAVILMRQMTAGQRTIGRFLSALIFAEHARREERAKERAKWTQDDTTPEDNKEEPAALAGSLA